MAFDGITVSAITSELRESLLNSRIYKIAQPEADELLLTLKPEKGQVKLLISADATLPLIYLTEDSKLSPMVAPNFCMLLRKHILNGRIVDIKQPSLERIIEFEIEHMDELGDMRRKSLIVELMGKHSNIIFTDENKKIIDSIKHVNSFVSSVREVLPGRDYFIPNADDKINPLDVDKATFIDELSKKPIAIQKALYQTFTGFSPVMSEELCYRANIDSSVAGSELDLNNLYSEFEKLICDIKAEKYSPNIIYDKGTPKEFAAVVLSEYEYYAGKTDIEVEHEDSISKVLYDYYSKKATVTRIRQKSADLRKIVATILERNIKKYDLQLRQLKDTEKKDKYKVYGELINTYGYSVEPGAKSFECDNYYTGEKITIPLDEMLSTKDNAKKYFDKYNKLKRTEEAAKVQAEETKKEIDHLESIKTSLDIAVLEQDLTQIKEEMIESGYIKRKGSQKKKERVVSKPFHYVSSDGFDMYVGKNNFQNDELTFKFANGNDYWFHAKKIPGSHVILKTDGKEVPDRTFEEAAALAAFYSKGSNQDKVDVDYVIKKEVKKPQGSNPGFVVYYTNYSMTIKPDISAIQLIE